MQLTPANLALAPSPQIGGFCNLMRRMNTKCKLCSEYENGDFDENWCSLLNWTANGCQIRLFIPVQLCWSNYSHGMIVYKLPKISPLIFPRISGSAVNSQHPKYQGLIAVTTTSVDQVADYQSQTCTLFNLTTRGLCISEKRSWHLAIYCPESRGFG